MGCLVSLKMSSFASRVLVLTAYMTLDLQQQGRGVGVGCCGSGGGVDLLLLGQITLPWHPASVSLSPHRTVAGRLSSVTGNHNFSQVINVESFLSSQASARMSTHMLSLEFPVLGKHALSDLAGGFAV